AAGTYTATLTTATCDSVATLTLVVNEKIGGAARSTICTARVPYTWNGQNRTAAGIYTATLTTATCDSVATLLFVVNENLSGSETITICGAQLPYTWNGQNLTEAGTYTATLTTATCDSVATLTLVVNENLSGSETITICTAQLPYTWNGQNLTAAGTYTATLTTATCDSVATLTLVVNENLSGSETITICTAQSPYTWNGQNLTAAGTYTATLTTATCDSVATLTLVVNENLTGSETITICAAQLPYTWNGQNLRSEEHTSELQS